MTAEEQYARLLAKSALETKQAQKLREIKDKPQINVFNLIGHNNEYDVDVIIEEFAALAQTTRKNLMGYVRTEPTVSARHVLIHTIHKEAGISASQIARMFKKDPSTILSSIANGKRIVEENPFLQKHIEEVLAKAKARGENE